MCNRSKQSSETNPIRILVVEDNVPNQLVECAILESAGYMAEVASDGRAAIKALESSPFDLVLMDCSMPVMDGFSATRSIRAPGSRVIDRSIPIIALTASALQEDAHKCLQAGMDDYVKKPVDPAKLIGMIERYLGRTPHGEPGFADSHSSEDTRRAGQVLTPELLDDVIEMFYAEVGCQIAGLQVAIESADYDELGFISHKLRGSSELLGIGSIATLACAIDKAARQEDHEQVLVLAPKLLLELQRLLAELAGADPEVMQ